MEATADNPIIIEAPSASDSVIRLGVVSAVTLFLVLAFCGMQALDWFWWCRSTPDDDDDEDLVVVYTPDSVVSGVHYYYQ